MRKRERFERDERLSVLHNFILGFGGTFLVIFFNSYGLIFLYNKLLQESVSIGYITVYIILYLVFGCLVSSIIIYFTRIQIYSKKIQQICKAAQQVAQGDFSVRLDVIKGKVNKNEIDILKEDFNTMVSELSSIDGLRDSFIADVSHEIKTPLSVIQGYAELLQSPSVTREQQKEYINNIYIAVNNLKTLTSNILKLNKLENQVILQTEVFSLDEQIRCCVLGFEEQLDDKKINVDVSLEEIRVRTDPGLLEIIWNNLLLNAIKFNDFEGSIVVRLMRKGDDVCVSFADSGCGISKTEQKRIFEKFYQSDNSRSQDGNGLGLALVKKVLDLLNGDISVKSEQGKGTEFIIRIPDIAV